MHETVDVSLADLQLDTANARLGSEQASQQATYLALAKQQGRRLLKLAEDIVASGLDPSNLPIVVATGDRRKRYKVIEGNRRILALKALETPTIILSQYNSADQRRWVELAKKYVTRPIDQIQCILFDDESDALHWVELRHTGANDGMGLTEWDANEKDRFRSRHSSRGRRQPAGQVLDFVARLEGTSDGANAARILTNVQRLISTKAVREALGIETVNGDVVSRYPTPEVAKGLVRIVDDLRTGRIKVKDIYDAADRTKYISGFASDDLPNPSKLMKQAIPLEDLPITGGTARRSTRKAAKAQPVRSKAKAPRTALVPVTCPANVSPPRINAIYNELATLNVDQFPNTCAVSLRVFLELSVDHEIIKEKLMTETTRRSVPLAKRMKAVAGSLHTSGKIDGGLKLAIEKIADSKDLIAASTTTFNQYVHNQYVYPKPQELRTAWDELQPFIEALWP